MKNYHDIRCDGRVYLMLAFVNTSHRVTDTVAVIPDTALLYFIFAEGTNHIPFNASSLIFFK